MTRATAVTLLCTAACTAVWLSGSLHPAAAPACVAWLIARDALRTRFFLRLPSNLVGIGGIGLFVLFIVFNKPSHDPRAYLLGFLTAALLLINVAEPTRFNEYLIVLGSLIVVVVSATAAAGLLPFFITAMFLFVACHALLILTRRPQRDEGVRLRLSRDPGRWSLASAFASHHLAGAGLIVGTVVYLSVPRLGHFGSDGEIDAHAERLLAGRTGRVGALGTESVTGFPSRVKLGDIGQIKRNTRIAFEANVRVSGRPYDPPDDQASMMLLRARTWDVYSATKREWTKRRQRKKELGRRGVLELGDAPVDWTFSFRDYAGTTLFLPQRTKRVRVFGTDLRVDSRGAVRVRERVRSYGAEAALPVTGREQFARLRPDDSDPYLLEVPPELVPDLKRVLGSALRGVVPRPRSGAILQAVDSVRLYFVKGGFRYTLQLPHTLPPDQDPVIAFLERGEGHCELFATAACLFLRLAGIPARLAGGMRCAERIGPGQYRARHSNAHAWVEIPCRGVGYVALDFTPPDTDSVEPGTRAEDAAGGSAWRSRRGIEEAAEAPVISWSEPFRYGQREQERLMRWVSGKLDGVLLPLFAAAALALVGWGLFSGLKERRARRPRLHAPTGVAQRTLAFYVRFLHRCARHGHRKQRTETPREFLRTLPPELHEAGVDITARFERRRYG